MNLFISGRFQSKIGSRFFVFCLLFAACQSVDDRRLEQALDLAGSNRAELEKVLDYYSRQEADSLKWQAACFLIRNMPGHYSFADKKVDLYYENLEKVLSYSLSIDEKRAKADSLGGVYGYGAIRTVQDIHVIKSDYLIKHIESAFRDWKEGEWARQLSFEDFCEYLLPYKCKDLQALDGWRDSLCYLGDVLRFYSHSHVKKQSAYWAAAGVSKNLVSALGGVQKSNRSYAFPPFKTPLWTKIPSATCAEYAVMDVAVLRSVGIPAVNDFILQWAGKDASHSWVTILIDEKHKIQKEGCHSSFVPCMRPNEKKGKVYRSTYAINQGLLDLNQRATHVPPHLRTLFMQDVTKEYVATQNVVVSALEELEQDEESFAYLAVYSDGVWQPIDYAKFHVGQAQFADMEKGVVYLPVFYDKKGIRPMNFPILLDEQGVSRMLQPDKTKKRTITLERKYPILNKAYDAGLRMLGGMFQAANKADFSDAVICNKFVDYTISGTVEINDTTPYRYWRYYNPEPVMNNIAEIYFVDAKGQFVRGEIIGTKGDESHPEKNKKAAFDNDPFTYFEARVVSGGWVGMDFGHPVRLSEIKYLARSDDNNIRIDDVYELYYWDADGWVSLGQQEAKDLTLTFDHVPANALLILRDHTRGKDERIFLYEDGKQVWY